MSQIDQSTEDQVPLPAGNGVATAVFDLEALLAIEAKDRLAAIAEITKGKKPEAAIGLLLCVAVVDDDEEVPAAAFAAVESIDPELAVELDKIREGDLYLLSEALTSWINRQDLPAAILAHLAYINQQDDDFEAAKFKQPLQAFAAAAPDLYTQAAITVAGIMLHYRNDQPYCFEWKHRQSTTWAARYAALEPALVSLILQAAKTDNDRDVRAQAIRTLGKFGPKANVALHDLVHIATTDHDDQVQKAVWVIITRYMREDVQKSGRETEKLLKNEATLEPTLDALARFSGAPSKNIAQQTLDIVLDQKKRADYDTRRKATELLSKWALSAGGATDGLIKIAIIDDDDDVREAANRALKRLDLKPTDQAEVLIALAPELLKPSKDDKEEYTHDAYVRERLVAELGQLGPAGAPAGNELKYVIFHDPDQDVRDAAAKALPRISTGDPAIIAELAASLLADLKSTELKNYGLITKAMEKLGHEEINRRGVEFIWRRVPSENDRLRIYSYFRAGLTLNGDALLDKTLSSSLDQTHVLQLGRALVDKHPEALSKQWATLQKNQEKEALLALLSYVEAARDRSDKDYDVEDVDKVAWETRRNAVIWLGSSESSIQKLDESRHEAIYEELKQRLEGDRESNPQFETDADVRTAINIVLLLFERTIEANAQDRLLSKLRQKDADVDAAVHTLVAKENWKALRDLIRFWVEWVVLDDKYVGVAIAEEELRKSPLAVLPLVERLKHPLLKSDLHLEMENGQNGENALHQGNVQALLNLFVPTESHETMTKLWYAQPLTDRERYHLQEWFTIQYGRHEALTDEEKKQLADLPPDLENATHGLLTTQQLQYFLNKAVDITLKQRDQVLRRRITALLATMSNPYYLQESQQKDPHEVAKNKQRITEIREDLQRHLVSYYSTELRTENDIEVLENMARTLANLADAENGQNAIDALVYAVVGEERRQNRRQELLFDYYLEPSKRRSDEAAKILEDAVDQAKATLGTLRRLNQHLFYVGLAVFVAGFAVAVFSQDGPTKALGIFSGLGGLAGVLRHMVKDPLDRIQNAMGNLVQMEAAFTSFMWKLNLNQTFIQSRYVANGHLTQDEIQTTVNRVEHSIRSTMSLVETYTETSAPRIVTRLHKITPVSAALENKGTEVTIHGQYLFGDDMDKKDGQGVIALNHVPVEADVVKWEIDQVQLRLRPEDIQVIGNGQIPDSILISLFIDGMETNALPLRLIRAQNN